MITISVNGRKATKTAGELITSGSVGIEVRFEFDSTWDGLSKIACFSGSGDRDQLPTDNVCTIPWECLKTSGRPVVVGVYGADGTGAVVIPTVYCNIGMVQRGAKPSNSSSQAATPTAVDQMLSAAQTCTSKATSAANSASSALAGVATADREIATLIEHKEDKLIAGSNITLFTETIGMSREYVPIRRTTISAADNSYDDTELRGRITTIESKEAGWDAKQDALTAGDRITLSGSTISADNQVFYAINGTTAFDDIKTAYTAGYAIFCKRSGSSVMNNGYRVLPLTYVRTTGGNAQFCFTDVSVEKTADGTSDLRKLIYCICRPDGWTSDVINDVKTVNGVAPGNDGNIALTIPAALTAGEGISITNNVISATGGSVGAAFILALQSILDDAVFTADRSADIADLINHAGGDLPDGDGVSY